jgi:outer membrane biosynthesis protein TonB
MFIKLTRTDGTPVWLNPEFIVRIEPWKKGSAVAAAGDGDFEVMEDPRAILAMAGGVRVSRPATGETPVGSVEPTATGETPVVPVEPVATGETPVVPVRKTRSRKKAVTEPEPAPTAAPTPEPVPEPAPEPPPAPEPANDLFPQEPDEVAVAAAILKKNRCRSRKRIENTIKSMNPKMSMADARALLQQMEARGFVLIDAQGHATFT